VPENTANLERRMFADSSNGVVEFHMPAFINGGTDAVYPLLESCYRSWFEADRS